MGKTIGQEGKLQALIKPPPIAAKRRVDALVGRQQGLNLALLTRSMLKVDKLDCLLLAQRLND